MASVEENIPDPLRPEVEAALAWFNAQSDVAFEVTGILDPEAALAQTGSRELRLVLCGGDRCEQRSFRVTSGASGYEVAFATDPASDASDNPIQPELDPPPGALRGWLDAQLTQHAFVVLVFYRGFW